MVSCVLPFVDTFETKSCVLKHAKSSSSIIIFKTFFYGDIFFSLPGFKLKDSSELAKSSLKFSLFQQWTRTALPWTEAEFDSFSVKIEVHSVSLMNVVFLEGKIFE